jgi:hypothetical protein
MSYADHRAELFTDQGLTTLLKIQENVERLIGEAGAVRVQEAFKGVTGDTWLFMAALDYLVEKGEIREVTDSSVWGQYRVFVEDPS